MRADHTLSLTTGEYVVEESEATVSGAAAGTVYRRLVFLRNQQFIQTEVQLVPLPSGKHKKKKKKSAADEGLDGAGGGDASAPAEDTIVTMDAEGKKPLRFSHQYLDAHHCSILAGLSLLVGAKATSGLLVGLGGGALPMAVRRHLPAARLTVCELDPSLRDIARRYFGYCPDGSVQDVVADGMDYIRSAALALSTAAEAVAAGADTPPPAPDPSALLDFVVLDADSADSSRGLSAPPEDFTSDEAVGAMRRLLTPQGLLIINTVARDKNELKRFVDAIKGVFVPFGGGVYIMKPSEDTVNLTIVAVNSTALIAEKAAALFSGSGSGSVGAGKKGKKAASAPAGTEELRSVVQHCVQQMLREVQSIARHVYSISLSH